MEDSNGMNSEPPSVSSMSARSRSRSVKAEAETTSNAKLSVLLRCLLGTKMEQSRALEVPWVPSLGM